MNKNLLGFFVQILIIVLLAGGAAVITVRNLPTIPLSVSQTTTAKESAFSVKGASKITTVPDLSTLHLGITKKETSLKLAQDSANQVMNSLSQALEELGLPKKDMQTSNYQVYPNYDYTQPERTRIQSYTVQVDLELKVRDFEKLNLAIDKATSLGINNVGGVNFGLSDEKQALLKSQARKEAIENAQKNAQELSQLSGLKLGKVINVQEVEDYASPMRYKALPMMAGGVAAEVSQDTQLQPGSSFYNFEVIVSYETL